MSTSEHNAKVLLKRLGELEKLEPVLVAAAKREVIQYKSSEGVWADAPNAQFTDPADRYRIKPKAAVVKYRRYVWRATKGHYYLGVVNSQTDIDRFVQENAEHFVKWIDTEWQTVEVTEGTAE